MRHGAPLACLVVMCALVALACGERAAAPPGFVTVAVAIGPNNLDPRVGADEASQRVQELVFGSLFRLDEQLRVVPELATSWETPDPLTYVVHLRRDVRFHDGSDFDAADVIYTFSTLLSPELVSPKKGAYRMVASVSAIDRHTVRFGLTEPFGSFPINLVLGIVPDGAEDVPRTPIGTGPYRLVEHRPDDRVVLEAFSDYFAGPPANLGLVLRVVPDDTMRGLELRKGTVDLVINDLAPDVVHQLARDGQVEVTTAPGVDYQYLGINLRDPILSDVRVRRALAHAIDRQAIVTYLRRDLATAAVGILPPMSWAFEADVPEFEYDPERARALLDAAGFPDPDGEGPASRFDLTLRISTAEFTRLQAAIIQSQLQDVGVVLRVASTEFATLYADVLRGNVQMYSLQWVGVSDPDMLRRVFHSGQMPPVGFNRGFFDDPGVDVLLERAAVTQDEAVRKALYGAAQRKIAEAVPCISLWYKTNVAVHGPDVSGLRLTPTASFGALTDVRLARRGAEAPSGRALQ